LVCHTKVNSVWQTAVAVQVCHTSKAGTAGAGLAEVDYCGKSGVDAVFATRKWIPCGKQLRWAEFATQVGLE
jgi:hypothetical protein